MPRPSESDRPRLLVVAEGDPGELGRQPNAVSIDIRASERGELFRWPWDVLVVVIPGTSLGPVEWSLARWAALGRPEIVFVSSQLAALPFAATGVRYLVPAPAAQEWLGEHGLALARFSRARRALAEASQGLPRSPAEEEGEPPGLFQAEQQFRTTYIQMLLARSATRREAAQRARVAYRTFCHILEKLGLSSRKLRRQELALGEDPSLSLTDEGAAPKYPPREKPNDKL